MSALITSIEHSLAVAASDTVKVAKFVETSVLPVLKKAQADQSTIESITSLVSPQAANIERAGFAVLGVVISALRKPHGRLIFREGEVMAHTLPAACVAICAIPPKDDGIPAR